MIIIPAILESFRSLKDRTYKLTFETNELTPENMVGLNESLGEFGFLAFKKDAFKQSEKDTLNKLETDFDNPKKSKSQRLRAVLYLNWQKNSEGFKSQEQHYDYYLEKFIDHMKSKLD